MPQDTAHALALAYEFLRRVEHRIQYLDDQQTHRLPSDPADLQWMARSLGLSDTPDMLLELQQHRDRVAAEFERLLGQEQSAQSESSATWGEPFDWFEDIQSSKQTEEGCIAADCTADA
jgi:glutamate-ammonia-ligase adenylyltransferase